MIKLHLAPMEGVVDWVIRDLYTRMDELLGLGPQHGGIDQCVTEFVRVTNHVVVDEVLYRYMPELRSGGRTRSGVPVYMQFLGGQPEPIADTAARAVELGALGVDLNFGCPAKIVNRHDGGAALLKCPDRIFNIVSTVRATVPSHIPVTAKIRLGFDDPSVCLENAQAVESGGAARLTVHCRTKLDMYKPPAYWDWIPRIREKVSLPIVANGEIWTVEDFQRCREISGSDEIMIGRGAMADPTLALRIKMAMTEPAQWNTVCSLLLPFFDVNTEFRSPYYAQARSKQWLRQLCLRFKEAEAWFDVLKVISEPAVFRARLIEFTPPELTSLTVEKRMFSFDQTAVAASAALHP